MWFQAPGIQLRAQRQHRTGFPLSCARFHVRSTVLTRPCGARAAMSTRFARIEEGKETPGKWCPRAGSNHRHYDFQSYALPTELLGHRRRDSVTAYATGPKNRPRRERRLWPKLACVSSPNRMVFYARSNHPRRDRAPARRPAGREWRNHRRASSRGRGPGSAMNRRAHGPHGAAWRRSGICGESSCLHRLGETGLGRKGRIGRDPRRAPRPAGKLGDSLFRQMRG